MTWESSLRVWSLGLQRQLHPEATAAATPWSYSFTLKLHLQPEAPAPPWIYSSTLNLQLHPEAKAPPWSKSLKLHLHLEARPPPWSYSSTLMLQLLPDAPAPPCGAGVGFLKSCHESINQHFVYRIKDPSCWVSRLCLSLSHCLPPSLTHTLAASLPHKKTGICLPILLKFLSRNTLLTPSCTHIHTLTHK